MKGMLNPREGGWIVQDTGSHKPSTQCNRPSERQMTSHRGARKPRWGRSSGSSRNRYIGLRQPQDTQKGSKFPENNEPYRLVDLPL